jgi:magnesium transporter
MILCERYHPQTRTVEQVSPDQVAALLAQPEALLWIDLNRPDDAEYNWLAETFRFHPLALEDARGRQQRAKLDRYQGYAFFVLPAICRDTGDRRVGAHDVHVFIGRNYLVTVHRQEIPALSQVRHRWEQAHAAREPAPFLFYLLLDAVVDGCFPVVDEIGEQIDDIDTAVFADPDRVALKTIFSLRKTLLTIRKTLGPLRDALNELLIAEGDEIFALEHMRGYFSDVFDHVLRVTDFVDTYRDMLSGSLDAYQGSLANRLNQNMQRLTVAATVLATATVVTGFYGMNLRGLLINSRWAYGGHLLLGLLVLLTLVEIWIFRRKRWI